MRRFLVLAFLFIPVIASGQSTTSHQGAVVHEGKTAKGHPSFTATQTETAEGNIIAVNSKKRHVTILTEAGDTVVVTCGPEVKNFAHIKKGDVVKAKYTETLSIHVEPPGTTPETSAEATSSTANPGEKPHGMRSAKMTYYGTITAIDKTKGTVTLKGPEGDEVTVKPRNKANLSKVKVDDVVVFHYEASVAASVEKAPKK